MELDDLLCLSQLPTLVHYITGLGYHLQVFVADIGFHALF